MSQHILEVKPQDLSQSFTLVLGYDRPTNDSFWTIHPNGGHSFGSLTSPEHTLSSALGELGFDLENTIPLWDSVSKMMDAIFDEAVANDPSLASEELMHLIQEGTPLEEAQAKINKLREFKDFNRIVHYPEVVLN